MKNIFKIFAAVVLAFVAASCGRSVELEPKTFATFYSNSYSIAEDAGEISIPVQIYNPNGGEVRVTIEAVDGEGDAGAVRYDDYQIISPEGGVLVFSGKVDSLDVVVAVEDHDGDKQGSKNFSLKITSVTDGIPTGAINSTKITIRDMDHPLAHFIGQWTGSTKGYFTNSDYNFSFTFDSVEGDEESLFLEFVDPNVAPTPSYMILKVDSSTGPIVIPSMSFVGPIGDYQCYYSGLTTAGFDDSSQLSDMFINYNAADMTLSIPNAFGLFVPMDGQYALYEVYFGGMKLTKR